MWQDTYSLYRLSPTARTAVCRVLSVTSRSASLLLYPPFTIARCMWNCAEIGSCVHFAISSYSDPFPAWRFQFASRWRHSVGQCTYYERKRKYNHILPALLSGVAGYFYSEHEYPLCGPLCMQPLYPEIRLGVASFRTTRQWAVGDWATGRLEVSSYVGR